MNHYKKKQSRYSIIIQMQKLKEMNLKNQKASSKIKEQKLKKNQKTGINL